MSYVQTSFIFTPQTRITHFHRYQMQNHYSHPQSLPHQSFWDRFETPEKLSRYFFKKKNTYIIIIIHTILDPSAIMIW